MNRFEQSGPGRGAGGAWREWLCSHRGRRGPGRFEAGFEGGFGGRGARFRTGRKLASGDLQLVILALLAESPRHGYEIIKALEERSAGFYAPSPGMVYPALTYLDEIGHATVTADGARKLYSITEEGRARLAGNREAADAMLDELARIGAKMARVRQVFTGEDADGDEGFAGLTAELRQMRHELRAALRHARHAPPAEQRRVADSLRRALAEIRRGAGREGDGRS